MYIKLLFNYDQCWVGWSNNPTFHWTLCEQCWSFDPGLMPTLYSTWLIVEYSTDPAEYASVCHLALNVAFNSMLVSWNWGRWFCLLCVCYCTLHMSIVLVEVRNCRPNTYCETNLKKDAASLMNSKALKLIAHLKSGRTIVAFYNIFSFDMTIMWRINPAQVTGQSNIALKGKVT